MWTFLSYTHIFCFLWVLDKFCPFLNLSLSITSIKISLHLNVRILRLANFSQKHLLDCIISGCCQKYFGNVSVGHMNWMKNNLASLLFQHLIKEYPPVRVNKASLATVLNIVKFIKGLYWWASLRLQWVLECPLGLCKLQLMQYLRLLIFSAGNMILLDDYSPNLFSSSFAFCQWY